jgi:type II secretory pathway pseudopilin PulG
MIGVLAIMTIVGAVLAPNFVQVFNQQTKSEEDQTLKAIATINTK